MCNCQTNNQYITVTLIKAINYKNFFLFITKYYMLFFMESIEITTVSSASDLVKFVKVPFYVYKDDPYWVPPLIFERKEHLSKNNPFFEHAKAQYFIAFRNNMPAGRISAHIDYLYIKQHKIPCGFFGFLDAIDDIGVFRKLLEAAENWLKNEGMSYIMGPFSFSINDECGLLVKGFTSSPTIMAGFAKPYYSIYIEELGYTKEKDLHGYLLDAERDLPLFMKRMIEKTKDKIIVKSINKRDFNTYTELLRNIFNDSWTNNWGFVPFTENEFRYVAKQLKHIVEDDFVNIAYYQGEPAGMIVYLPNINEIIKDLNGRLFPIGFLKILYRLKFKRLKLARGILLGVRRQYHKNILATAIVSHMIKRMQDVSIRKGVSTLDISWVLEDNKGITELVERGNGMLYKVFRIYGKKLI